MQTKNAWKFLALAIGAMAAVSTPAIAWEPNKPVEIVVPFGAGGASDQMARSIQGIIAKHKLMSQPVIVLNKAGASGAEGLMDTKASPGNPHKLLVASSALYTVPMVSHLPFSWRDLTPVAMVAQDEFVLWTNSAAPYRTVSEFIDAARASGGKTRMGGTSSKREDQIITTLIQKKTGAKFIYVPYKGGGEAATQLSGQHIDANVNNPSESVAQWRAGEHRALCVFAPERMSYSNKVTQTQSWHDVPTCKEQGLDVQYQMLRVFMLPGGVTPEQQKYYVDLMQKVVATPEWKEYLEKSALKNDFITGKALTDFLAKDEAAHRDIIREAGFVASR
ncbi:Bug family tripartite tricarboxylate transporter substrate binding protein [Cupriavidus sp. IDO]|uniref:Bug family tripartite tricarboxylate transporter substrate binding protein n=1 Tax=Cupriavidus sp. IDO TaxID=1539142 RepID=UPI000578E4EE|nr:tripartite tricarboxylate transporter substrate binding protein [Cupriavidus sp. IDO]KWR88438.1 tricarboxylate transporter [Cupriavidus sp. IDO]